MQTTMNERHIMPDTTRAPDRGNGSASATAEPPARTAPTPASSSQQTGTTTAARAETVVEDWRKPAAKAIPKGGLTPDHAEQGRYGPIFPKTPACYGFSIIAKIIPGREEKFYEYARNIEKAVAETPDVLAVLKL